MPNPLCVAVLAAVLIPPLALGLRRRWRTRTSVLATRLGARLPPTWRPPEARAVRVPEPAPRVRRVTGRATRVRPACAAPRGRAPCLP